MGPAPSRVVAGPVLPAAPQHPQPWSADSTQGGVLVLSLVETLLVAVAGDGVIALEHVGPAGAGLA